MPVEETCSRLLELFAWGDSNSLTDIDMVLMLTSCVEGASAFIVCGVGTQTSGAATAGRKLLVSIMVTDIIYSIIFNKKHHIFLLLLMMLTFIMLPLIIIISSSIIFIMVAASHASLMIAGERNRFGDAVEFSGP